MATTISHSKSGAKAQVYAHGATVTSFTTSDGRELIFLSKDAKLDGSKAIRGGVPLVFPQFGQPDKSMPQHGFLRNNTWKEVSTYDADDSAGITFELKLADVVNSRGGIWDVGTELDCVVTMALKINATSLTQTLTIQNTATTAFDFQTLFHTYFQVQNHEALDKSKCNVVGLEGYKCEDKITNETYVTSSAPIGIGNINVDHVYTPPAGKEKVNVTIRTGNESSVKLSAYGTVNGVSVPASCVVWNPYKEKAEAMSDLNNDAYFDMICVEPGLLANIPKLQGGDECVFEQVITT